VTVAQTYRLSGFRVQQAVRGVRLRFGGYEFTSPIKRIPAASSEFNAAEDEKADALIFIESSLIPSTLVRGSYLKEVENPSKQYRVSTISSPSSDVLTTLRCQEFDDDE